MKNFLLSLFLLFPFVASAKENAVLLDKTPAATSVPSDTAAIKFDATLGRVEAKNSDATSAPFANPSVTAATPVSGVKAAVTLDPTGSNNNVTYTAVGAGVRYNSLSVRYVISGSGSAVLSVGISNSLITVTAGSATTAQSVITAVNASTAVSAYVVASASGTVTSAIAAVSATSLTGGIDCTPAKKGEMRFDSTYLYIATSELTISSTTGWRKIAHSAL